MFRTVAALAAVFSLLVSGTPASASPTGIDGTVTSAATGLPMKGIQVIAKTPDGGWVRDGFTNDAGKFDIPLTAGRQYRIFAHASEHEEHLSEPVTAPGSVSIAMKPFTYGSVRGTYLRKPGEPIANVGVVLTDHWGNDQERASTDVNGGFRFAHVRSGQHKLRFYYPYSTDHWYDGGTAFTVQADQEFVVEQFARPMGSAEVTIRDRATGEPMPNVAVDASLPVELGAGYTVRTDAEGKARYENLLTGKWRFLIQQPTGYLYETIEDVEVKTDETAVATGTLQREAVFELTFTDAATGAPVDGCYISVYPDRRNVVDWNQSHCGYDGTGKLRVNGYWPGRERFFVYPRASASHGSQWVGENGGTGDVDQAKWFEFVSGQTTAVQVKFDGAGTISGSVVDDASGAAVSGLCPSVTPSHYYVSQGRNVKCTYTEGRYEISGLGPYAWKVQFPSEYGDHAWQWSGGAADRFSATPVQVTPGGTATADARLKKPGRISGKLVNATRPFEYTTVLAVNSVTGDYAGPSASRNSSYEYSMKGYATQDVRMLFHGNFEDEIQTHPDLVHVQEGQETSGVDLQVR
ncbi:carboxypeptidase-like regulatory domain-containing protein [Lentzea sp. NPDC034063]|uniref:carboxypeptidase-like regulatory domain-containing protein n=1 Tax=unclassified Lentzea TaxID=2643253 RepID=UPI0033FCD2DA